LPLHLAGLAVLLCLPSLWLGWQADDFMHRASLLRLREFPEIVRPPWDLFRFMTGVPAENLQMIDAGLLPWWTHERMKGALLRPLTCLTHWLDYQLWPDSAWLMHVHSLAWFGGVVALAAVFYRRMIATPFVAGLAALLFALDDAHGIPASWLANRNATTAMFFGLLTLLAYDRWRRDGWAPGAWLAPAALLLAVLSGEAAVATGGYLLAYAMFIDPAPRARRWLALLPCTTVGAVWWLSYKLLGYGVAGSEFYVDPGTNPLRFVAAALERAPLLLWGQWATPPCEGYVILSQDAARVAWWAVVILLGLLAAVIWPTVRKDAVARFWCVGMLLAVVPMCATLAGDRLLFFVSLGGAGLLAQFLAAVCEKGFSHKQEAVCEKGFSHKQEAVCEKGFSHKREAVCEKGFSHKREAVCEKGLSHKREVACETGFSHKRLSHEQAPRSSRLTKGLAVALIVCHLVIAPVNLALAPLNLKFFGGLMARAAGSLPADPGVVDRQVLIMNTPAAFFSVFTPVIQALKGKPVPARTFVLGSGIHATHILRRDANTLVIRPEGGYYPKQGSLLPGTPQPAIYPGYILQIFDRLFRDDAHPMAIGERLALTGLTITIESLTPDGRPADVAFRFDLPLDDPSFDYLQWSNGVFTPVSLPAVGASLTLAPVAIPF